MQQLLLDRRLVLAVLDSVNIPTPKRLVTWHNDMPHISDETLKKLEQLGINIRKYSNKCLSAEMLDSQTISVDSQTLSKPFVEKPVSGEDHNVFVYYSKEQGGGVRRYFINYFINMILIRIAILLTKITL